MVAASIPSSFYVITSSNNKVWFNEGGSTLSATVTPGNYTVSELAIALQTVWDAAAAATITVAVDTNAGKFTVASDGGTFELETTTTTSALWSILGFSTDADHTGATSYTAENYYDILAYIGNYLFIRSSMTSSNEVYETRTDGHSNIMAMVPVSPTFDNVVYLDVNTALINTYEVDFPISEIHWTLTTQDGNTVDLNGREWSVTIQITGIDVP